MEVALSPEKVVTWAEDVNSGSQDESKPRKKKKKHRKSRKNKVGNDELIDDKGTEVNASGANEEQLVLKDVEDDSEHDRNIAKHKVLENGESHAHAEGGDEHIQDKDCSEESKLLPLAEYQTENHKKKRHKKKHKHQKMPTEGDKIQLKPLKQPHKVTPAAPKRESDIGISGPYHWDTVARSPHMQIVPNQPHLITREMVKQSTDGARGNQALTAGKVVFLFCFSQTNWGSHCAIGLCTKDADLHMNDYGHLLGKDKHSWGWDIPSGELLHDGQVSGHLPHTDDQIPKLLVLLVDMEEGRASVLLKHDQQPHPLFTGLQSRALYPAVSCVYAGMTVEITHKDGSQMSNADFLKMAADFLGSKDVDHLDNASVLQHRITTTGSEWEALSNNMYLHSDDQSRVCRKLVKQSTDGARGKAAVKTGKTAFIYQFETTPWGSHCSIGVCEKQAKLCSTGYTHLFGMDEHSWVWDIPSRRLLHNKQEDKTCGQDLKHIPKVLAVILDMEDGSLSVLMDPNVGIETAFTGLSGKELYAVVSMVYGGMSVSLSEMSASNIDSKEFISMVTDKVQSIRESLEDSNMLGDNLPYPKIRIDRRDWSTEETELIELAHGWDLDRGKGCNISVVPNTSTVCSPKGLLDISIGKMEAVRGRVGFTSGIHRWKIQQICLWHINLLERDSEMSEVAIGVANEHHSKLNYGYLGTFDKVLQQAGRGVWMWDVQSHYLLRGHTDIAHVRLYPKSEKTFDINKGIIVVLNVEKGELSFEDEDGNYGIAFRNIQGETLYPFLLFKNPVYPIKMTYLDGPNDHIERQLLDIRGRFEQRESLLTEIVSHRLLSTANIDFSKLEYYTSTDEYAWKAASPGLKITNHNEVNVSTDLVLGFAQWSLTLVGHLHELHYCFVPSVMGSAGKYTIGVVSPENNACSKEGSTVGEVKAMQLGENSTSWGWNVRDGTLLHAGQIYAKYPWTHGFRAETIKTIRMTLNMKNWQQVELSFAVKYENAEDWLDLGVAFSDLPMRLIPALSCTGACTAGVRLDYVRGPTLWADIATTSKCCNVM